MAPRRDTKAHLVQFLHFTDGETESTQGGLTQGHVSVLEPGLLAQKSVQSAPAPDSGRSFWQPQGTTRPGEADMWTQKAKIGKLFSRSKEEGILQVTKPDGLPRTELARGSVASLTPPASHRALFFSRVVPRGAAARQSLPAATFTTSLLQKDDSFFSHPPNPARLLKCNQKNHIRHADST